MTTPDTEYAFWKAPDTAFTITYSLPVFHEIDFQVSEGFRRIPHGGIEIGGVLFGRLESNSAQIDAFRLIECEHLSGPSFVLSERDLSNLRDQLEQAKNDAELKSLEPVGWFVAHTRSPLRMNEREIPLFDQFFPGAGKIMLLVKPERFQPTRFGFLVRDAKDRVPTDATQQAIILPLPGRASRSANGPVPSIPAPPESAPPTAGAPEKVAPPTAGAPEKTAAPLVTPEKSAVPSSSTVSASKQIPPPERSAFALEPYSAPKPLAAEEIKRRRSELLLGSEDIDAITHRRSGDQEPSPEQSTLRLVLILLIAAFLGCGVGYWAYLQLPAANIALHIRHAPSALLLTWPPEQTRDAVYAAIRIDDGPQTPLSSGEKRTGQAEIKPAGANVKIELIAQHWMRDSRGIVRYVKPLPAIQAVPAPANNTPAPSEAGATAAPPQ